MLRKTCLILFSVWTFSLQADTGKCGREFKTILGVDFQENIIRKKKKEWMSYEEAKTFIQAQGIKTSTQFLEWKRDGKRPKNFPSHPQDIYKEWWTTWNDFFGSENISTRKKEWMSYKEAEDFIQNQGIKDSRAFEEWKKAGKRPKDFPSAPYKTYKGKGWKNWKHFFGTEWMSYEEAKISIRGEGITSKEQFIEWSKSGNRPTNLPFDLRKSYEDKWIGWRNFLGTENTALTKHKWMDFEDAKKFIQAQGIKTSTQFLEWKRAGKRPKNFPSHPQDTYKNEWINWGDFLGTGNTINYIRYSTARKYIQSLNFDPDHPKEFIEWLKSSDRPTHFPPNPHQFYSEWASINDFLSTEQSEYMSYEEATVFVQFLGLSSPRDFLDMMKFEPGIFPENFPIHPQVFYKNSDEWIDWNDFLGLTNSSQKNDHKVSNTNHLDKVINPDNDGLPLRQRLFNLRNTSSNKKSTVGQEENIETEDLELEESFIDKKLNYKMQKFTN